MKRKQNDKQFIQRLRTVFWFVVLIGFVLVTNLFYIQVKNGDDFRSQADGQYVTSSNNIFKRGNILFEQKDGSLITAATQKKGYKIAINPQKIQNPERVYDTLSEYIKSDRENFLKQVANKKRTYIEIAHQVDREKGDLFKKELGKDILVYPEFWRIYPLQGSAAHVLGFLGYQGNEYAGRYGLERSFDETLKREDSDLYKNFFARVFHDVQNFIDTDYKQVGDIISSIDPQVQLFFEQQLLGIQEKWNSASVGGIIMDPKTGEIYSMAAYPNFNNNNFSESNLEYFKNPLVENMHEMGSIIKPLVMAIALDQGVLNSETRYYDEGFVDVGKHRINNFDKKGRGWVTMQDVLNQSLNTGMVFVNEHIPKKTFRNYFENYGFGEKTGIDLPNESLGLVSNLESNRDIEFANISFGQGIAMSPISVVKALSSLANDGIAVTPHIIKKIEYTNGFSNDVAFEQGTQVLKPETSEEITRMLVNVFDNYSNGGVKFDHYRVAAKTGTAQIPNPEGGYYGDRNLHSFFGYFPAYEPEFIVFLYTVYPKNIKYASQTLINPFKETAKYLINYYNIPPDRI